MGVTILNIEHEYKVHLESQDNVLHPVSPINKHTPNNFI